MKLLFYRVFYEQYHSLVIPLFFEKLNSFDFKDYTALPDGNIEIRKQNLILS